MELADSETGTDHSDQFWSQQIKDPHDEQKQKHHEVKNSRSQHPGAPIFPGGNQLAERGQEGLFYHILTQNTSKKGGNSKGYGEEISGSSGAEITGNNHLPYEPKHSGDKVSLHHIEKFSKKGFPHETPASLTRSKTGCA